MALNTKENVIYRMMRTDKRVTKLNMMWNNTAHRAFSAARHVHMDVGPLGRDIYINTTSHGKRLSCFKLNTDCILLECRI